MVVTRQYIMNMSSSTIGSPVKEQQGKLLEPKIMEVKKTFEQAPWSLAKSLSFQDKGDFLKSIEGNEHMKVTGVLGNGSFGTVYSGFVYIPRILYVCVVTESTFQKLKEWFLVCRAIQLNPNANIINVHDCGFKTKLNDHKFFIITDKLGQAVQLRSGTLKRLPLKDRIRLAGCVIRGVAHIHSLNILIGKKGMHGLRYYDDNNSVKIGTNDQSMLLGETVQGSLGKLQPKMLIYEVNYLLELVVTVIWGDRKTKFQGRSHQQWQYFPIQQKLDSECQQDIVGLINTAFKNEFTSGQLYQQYKVLYRKHYRETMNINSSQIDRQTMTEVSQPKVNSSYNSLSTKESAEINDPGQVLAQLSGKFIDSFQNEDQDERTTVETQCEITFGEDANLYLKTLASIIRSQSNYS